MSAFALVLSLIAKTIWSPLTGFSLLATIAVPVVIVVYMIITVGCIHYYLTVGQPTFNPLLHIVLPMLKIVLFFLPLYYQYIKAPPTYPIKATNWIALA